MSVSSKLITLDDHRRTIAAATKELNVHLAKQLPAVIAEMRIPDYGFMEVPSEAEGPHSAIAEWFAYHARTGEDIDLILERANQAMEIAHKKLSHTSAWSDEPVGGELQDLTYREKLALSICCARYTPDIYQVSSVHSKWAVIRDMLGNSPRPQVLTLMHRLLYENTNESQPYRAWVAVASQGILELAINGNFTTTDDVDFTMNEAEDDK